MPRLFGAVSRHVEIRPINIQYLFHIEDYILMSVHSSSHANINSSGENCMQPVIYQVMPNQMDDEINLGELFSRLGNQWKLILGITTGGCLLAVFFALMLPNVYQPAVIVSMPPAGNIAPIIEMNTLLGGNSITAATKSELENDFSESQISTINTLFGGNNAIPATPQDVFHRYFNLFRSDKTLAEYIDKNQYLKKIYPNEDKPASALLAKLLKGWSIKILEPSSSAKDGYVGEPKRVKVSLEANDEAIGVDLLNGYAKYVNRKLITIFQNNASRVIAGKAEVLGNSIAIQRGRFRQQRVLTIEKIEHENAKKIAVLQEQITAALNKAHANRNTRIAHAKEALKMAKTLGVINPSTMDIMAKKGLKNTAAGTSITVVDKQAVPLYLYGSKYLSMLIETLNDRSSDEVFLNRLSELKEKIHVIKNDAALIALKERKTDDPWIEGLSGELSRIDAIKNLAPDFSNVLVYTMDAPAIVTDKPVKPKRKLIVVVSLFLSLFIGVFVALIVGSKKSIK